LAIIYKIKISSHPADFFYLTTEAKEVGTEAFDTISSHTSVQAAMRLCGKSICHNSNHSFLKIKVATLVGDIHQKRLPWSTKQTP